MRTSPKLLTTAVLAASLIACGGQDQETQSRQVNINKSPSAGAEAGTQTLSFDLNVRSALAAGISASNAKVTITKGDLQRTQNVNLDGDSASVSFNSLPIGEYQVAIQVMDGTTVVAQGSGTANVNADIQSEIDLVLNAVTGNLQVNLCMPDSNVEYQTGSLTRSLVMNQLDNLATDYSQRPAVQELTSTLTGKTNLGFNYRFGDGQVTRFSGTIFENGGAPIPAVVVNDHGAELTVTENGAELIRISGCDTEVMYQRVNSELWVSYKLPGDNPDFNFDIQLSGINTGTVTTKGLAVSVVLRDTNDDAFPENFTHINQLDFSKFETTEVILGALRDISVSGVASYNLNSAAAGVELGFYVARTAILAE